MDEKLTDPETFYNPGNTAGVSATASPPPVIPTSTQYGLAIVPERENPEISEIVGEPVPVTVIQDAVSTEVIINAVPDSSSGEKVDPEVVHNR